MASNPINLILTFSDYTRVYQEKLDRFLNEFIDNRESDFIKAEIIDLERKFKYIQDEEVYIKIENGFLINKRNARINELRKKRRTTHFRIIEFLNQKLITNDKIESSESENLLDFSNAKGTEKIVMLQQLGILDFLKQQQPFSLSTNRLAEVISGFTGMDSTTVQSYINPMNNPSTSQRNNPMSKKKVVSKVNQELISIGFKLLE